MWNALACSTPHTLRGGVVTGVLLAIARMIGETAPLLFTALNNQFFSLDMGQPMANLPVVIYNFAMSPYENWQKLAWGGAALIAQRPCLCSACRHIARLRRNGKAVHAIIEPHQ